MRSLFAGSQGEFESKSILASVGDHDKAHRFRSADPIWPMFWSAPSPDEPKATNCTNSSAGRPHARNRRHWDSPGLASPSFRSASAIKPHRLRPVSISGSPQGVIQ
jgi:hypothetical protein